MAAQQRGEETHARILQAAQRCFAEHGYDATGVAEICACAGLSKGAFYHHFPTKQALFLELLDRWLAGLDAQMALDRANAANVPDALRRMAGHASRVFEDARGQLPLFLEFWTQAAHDPVIWEAMNAYYRRYRELFAGMIAAGVAEGSLQPVSPDLAARVLVAFAIGLILQGLLDPQGTDWGRMMQEGIQMLLSNLENEK